MERARKPHGAPPGAAERRRTAGHATPQPRPRTDRRRRPPPPPPGAIRGSIRISGARKAVASARCEPSRCGSMARRQRRPTVARRSTRDAAAEPRADRRHHPPRPPPGAIRGSIGISSSARIRRAAALLAATTWPAAIRGQRSVPGSARCRPQLRLSGRPRARQRSGLASGSSTASRRPLELKEAAGAGVKKHSICVGPALRRDRDTHM